MKIVFELSYNRRETGLVYCLNSLVYKEGIAMTLQRSIRV
jgi:hypothetical protein